VACVTAYHDWRGDDEGSASDTRVSGRAVCHIDGHQQVVLAHGQLLQPVGSGFSIGEVMGDGGAVSTADGEADVVNRGTGIGLVFPQQQRGEVAHRLAIVLVGL